MITPFFAPIFYFNFLAIGPSSTPEVELQDNDSDLLVDNDDAQLLDND